MGCGGYELLLPGSLQEFQHFDASFWLGGIRFNGVRSRLELREDFNRIQDSGLTRGALVVSCWSPIDGGVALNVIWDYTGQGSTVIDVKPLANGVFTSVGSVSIDEQDLRYFRLPRGLSPEQLQNEPPVGKVRVAAAQHSSDLGTTRANADKMIQLARQAAASHSKFIVFPEAALTGSVKLAIWLQQSFIYFLTSYLSQDLEENWALPEHINKFPRAKHPGEFAIQV